MTFRKSILLLISLGMIAALVACSSSSSHPTVITVTLSTAPTSLFVNDTLSITATTNDTAGVTWSCAPVGTCGTFSAATTLTGVATIYTAPAAVPTSTVVITATSVTNAAISASTPAITINPASGITVSLSTPPPASMPANTTATIAATTSDTAGVNWSCTPVGACGSFSPTTTLSTITTTYTAPSAASSVVVTATSVTDNAQFASAPVAITSAAATLADGSYVFSLSGVDSLDFSLYSVSGVFTIAGGAITGGEQDYVDFDNYGTDDLINPTGSSMTATADGNLQITLVTCLASDCTQSDTVVGIAGVETLNASVYPLNAAKAAIIEFDTAATASGELDLQDSTAIAATPGPAGYAFGLSGFDPNENILSIGGVINVDDLGGTVGTISGAGSIFDANDNSSGTTFQAETFAASTVSAPDAFGRVTFTLNPTDSVNFPQIVLVGYIVNANKIFLVETTDLYFGTTGGTAFSQGANTGTFTATTVSGLTYVAGLNGFDGFGAANAAGLFTLNADTTISGFINYNDLSGTGVQAPSPLTGGNWAEDVGTGRVSLIGVTDGIATFNAEIYLDGNGKLLTITLDTTDNLAGRGFQQSGVGAFTAGSFSGAYSMGATGWNIGENTEFDAVGTVTADGVGTFAGVTDLNPFFTPISDVAVSGTFTSASSGVFTGTITGLDVTTVTNSDAFSYYLVDPTGDNIMIETDPSQITLGYFIQQ
jgi:hypothetical protein